MKFKLVTEFVPSGDQPEAIRQLTEGILEGKKSQTLLGVTGSGKTFTIANVIANVQKPTLILSHNKTLAAQLYNEFKYFFPENAVEYFVSYYDYYQPEAYIPSTDTYIEKDLSINEEIERYRLSTTSKLLSGRRDIIVVSSVSCIYGIGNPAEFKKNKIELKKGQQISRNYLLHKLVVGLYSRTELSYNHGTFRVKGDTVEVFPAYADYYFKITFLGDEIEEIEIYDFKTGSKLEDADEVIIYPANMFVTSPENIHKAIEMIQEDLVERIDYFLQQGRALEAKRLKERVEYDLEMIRELGYCSGIENYSRYFDGRPPGSRPYCLMDYFPEDYLLIIDESHVTVPQIRGMYNGDRSRKETLVEYGFRLPAALDNRPLKFEEFFQLVNQVIYVSATPGDFEISESGGIIVEQIVRPTGIVDPPIEVRPSINQIDDLMNEIDKCVKRNERVLVTTLTKRMAEELDKYLRKFDIRSRYIHSDIDTLERVDILRDLRNGIFDVLIGVNLLREGLDLPEVSLVVILDADKEGFLRSTRSLIQTAGRAARNVNSKVIMYADKITESMQKAIDETNYKRQKQLLYNEKHSIIPKNVERKKSDVFAKQSKEVNVQRNYYIEEYKCSIAEDPVIKYMKPDQLKKIINNTQKNMERAAKQLDFIEAAKYRDELIALKKLLEEKLSGQS